MFSSSMKAKIVSCFNLQSVHCMNDFVHHGNVRCVSYCFQIELADSQVFTHMIAR